MAKQDSYMIIDDNAWSVKIGMFAEITCLSRKITCHIWVNNLRNKKLLEKMRSICYNNFLSLRFPTPCLQKGHSQLFPLSDPSNSNLKEATPSYESKNKVPSIEGQTSASLRCLRNWTLLYTFIMGLLMRTFIITKTDTL